MGKWTDECPEPECSLNTVFWAERDGEIRFDPTCIWKSRKIEKEKVGSSL
jgi:hypothetical protein